MYLGEPGEVECPILAISVGADPLCPSQSHPLLPKEEELAPDVTRYFIPGASHFPMLEEKGKFNHVVGEWLLHLGGEAR